MLEERKAIAFVYFIINHHILFFIISSFFNTVSCFLIQSPGFSKNNYQLKEEISPFLLQYLLLSFLIFSILQLSLTDNNFLTKSKSFNRLIFHYSLNMNMIFLNPKSTQSLKHSLLAHLTCN